MFGLGKMVAIFSLLHFSLYRFHDKWPELITTGKVTPYLEKTGKVIGNFLLDSFQMQGLMDEIVNKIDHEEDAQKTSRHENKHRKNKHHENKHRKNNHHEAEHHEHYKRKHHKHSHNEHKTLEPVKNQEAQDTNELMEIYQ